MFRPDFVNEVASQATHSPQQKSRNKSWLYASLHCVFPQHIHISASLFWHITAAGKWMMQAARGKEWKYSTATPQHTSFLTANNSASVVDHAYKQHEREGERNKICQNLCLMGGAIFSSTAARSSYCTLLKTHSGCDNILTCRDMLNCSIHFIGSS